MSTATTAPTTDETATRSLAALERAEADLRSIDLRSLKGEVKENVKDARISVREAAKGIAAARLAAKRAAE